MSSPAPSEILKHVKYFRAPDDRQASRHIHRWRFDEFDKFPPFMETEEEIRHVREAYKIEDPLLERTTKAHITDNSWPLQIIVSGTKPRGHDAYHTIISPRRRFRTCRRAIRCLFAREARRGSAFSPGKGSRLDKSLCVRMILFCCLRDTRSSSSNAALV